MTTAHNTPDHDLVQAALAGDPTAFGAIYDRYADRLYSYAITMLRDRDDAADATHDAFVKASQRLDQLKDPSKLRPWLFAIVRNEAHAQGRRRARVAPTEDLSDALVEEPDLAMGVKQEELRELVWSAADGLGERDQELLALHLVEGLDGDDLAEAMGVSTSHVHVMVSRMKDRVEKALGALLIARMGSDDCDDLQVLLADWDGAFTLEVRSRVTRHIESCEECTTRRAVLLAPANVLPAVMLVPAPEGLRDRVLSSVDAAGGSASTAGATWMKIAGVAAAAVVVGAAVWFGLANTGSDASAGAEAPTTTTPVSQNQAPATTLGLAVAPPSTSSTTTTIATIAGPETLFVDEGEIDFGLDGESVEITLTNSGESGAQWSVEGGFEAFSVAPSHGHLAPGEQALLIITVHRDVLVEGETIRDLAITSARSDAAVTVRATQENPPIVFPPSTTDGTLFTRGTCAPIRTILSVEVTDEAPVESVTASWSPDGVTTVVVAMTQTVDGPWVAPIGPYTVAGVDSVRIVATDDRGNRSGTSLPLTVVDC